MNETLSVSVSSALSGPGIVADRVAAGAQQSAKRTYSRNVVSVGFSLFVSAASGVLLPSYLTHHLSAQIYGGWILILQMSSYVGILDFGMQMAIAKYVAQHTAADDEHAVNQHASASTAIAILSGVIGLVASVVLALLVPSFFKSMPPAISHDVAKGVLLVGSSTAFMLACSPFMAFFRGLQRYAVPTASVVANKLAYVVVMIALVATHRSLTTMGWSMAALNVVTGVGQVWAWRRMLPHIQVRRRLVEWPIARQMLQYCAVLGIWTTGMLFITGLDLTIVGHYDFSATAFYAIAATPITFLILLMQAALNPLMPAVSALSVTRTAEAMGAMLARSTRYTTLLLEVAGLPLLLFGFSILTVWVGPAYARHSLGPMRLLIVAQIVRNLCATYATMVIGTGRQRDATLSTLCEAASNLLFSILLGKLYGAIGVAAGTLIGAVIGVLVHFVISMRKTQNSFRISPGRLFRAGVLRPGVAALPTLLLLPLFRGPIPVPNTLIFMLAWVAATGALACRFGLNAEERSELMAVVRARLRLRH